VPAGEPDAEGKVAEGSMNYLVAAQLAEMSVMRQSYSGGGRRSARRRQDK
jgi:hypothetical protein